jgi:hypothetical protein
MTSIAKRWRFGLFAAAQPSFSCGLSDKAMGFETGSLMGPIAEREFLTQPTGAGKILLAFFKVHFKGFKDRGMG